MDNQRTEYIIPLTDVSSQDGDFSDDDSTGSYNSYGSSLVPENEEDDASSQCSCSSDSSNSSASISIASDSESGHYDDTTFDDDTNESEESSESSDDYTGEESDNEEDWGYKFFPERETRIRFSREVEIHDTLSRNNYTAAEKMASFLTPKDKKAQWFYQNKAIAKLEWWLEASPEHRVLHKQEQDERGDDKFVPRGLHQMTDKGYDRMNFFKNACVDAVLQEQEAQWTAAGRPTRGILWNFETMASASMQISRGGIVESIKIAKRDEQQAQKAYRQMDILETQAKKSKRMLSSSRRVLSNNTHKILNSNAANAAAIAKKNLPPSPGTTTPTTVTTILTAAGEDSESALVKAVSEQPLDYLEVASIESTPSLLTYLDDRSIVTPPSETDKDLTRRMSLQEQQHPMCVLHESHHSFMTVDHASRRASAPQGGLDLGGGFKRRASAPPLRNQSTMSSLSRGD